MTQWGGVSAETLHKQTGGVSPKECAYMAEELRTPIISAASPQGQRPSSELPETAAYTFVPLNACLRTTDD